MGKPKNTENSTHPLKIKVEILENLYAQKQNKFQKKIEIRTRARVESKKLIPVNL